MATASNVNPAVSAHLPAAVEAGRRVSSLLAGAVESLIAVLGRQAERVAAHRRERRTVRALRSLSDHSLRDIGLSRATLNADVRTLLSSPE